MRPSLAATTALLACAACDPADRSRAAEPRDSAAATTAAAPAPVCLIDSVSIAGARLGMTLEEVRRALPDARLERQEDGEGALWVSVTLDTTPVALLQADEENTPIEWSRPVRVIETFHNGCRTADGIGPGVLVTSVERILGRTAEIVESEIESRQYITFERQPPWMTLRLDYSGIFADGARTTTRYADGARLFSVSISPVP